MGFKKQYDSLAPFYDSVIGKNNSSQNFLLKTSKKYLSKDSKILELGCGTAENLVQFAQTYKVHGIDISGEMIKLAKKKIPSGNFKVNDITDFSLKEKFDLIFCVYDTINHLPDFDSWVKLFKRVKEHLSPEGIFIFDFNTLYKLNMLAQSDIYPEFPGNDVLLLNVRKQNKNLFNWEIKYFKNQSAAKYELINTVIPESSYETEKILKELNKYFTLVNTYNENFKKTGKNSFRIFCAAKLK
jgi:SAM-dependent methyltransferase